MQVSAYERRDSCPPERIPAMSPPPDGEVTGVPGHQRKGCLQMNFKDKRTRRIAVASASALLVSAGGVTALSAFAVGQTLTFGPAATSATILGLDPVPATAGGTIAAGLSYGLKAVGASNAVPVHVQVLSGPASGSVLYKKIATNGAPTRA